MNYVGYYRIRFYKNLLTDLVFAPWVYSTSFVKEKQYQGAILSCDMDLWEGESLTYRIASSIIYWNIWLFISEFSKNLYSV